MPKPHRRFHTNSKKYKRTPETADDFLAAGIEYEESGDRWRPGDKPKAGRFYTRAIDAYASSLQQSPQSFDAAYNKARLQYQLTQDPELLPQASRQDLRQLLATTVKSHQACLALDPNNEDALFNAAQALTSLSEARVSGADTEVKSHLASAIDMFARCLQIQKEQYEIFTAFREGLPPVEADLDDDVDDEAGGVSLEGHLDYEDDDGVDENMSDASGKESQYAIVQKPVTLSALLDTSLALLDALSSMAQFVASTAELSTLISTAENLSTQTIQNLTPSLPGRQLEVSLATAIFSCALCEPRARFSDASVADWGNAITTSFSAQLFSNSPDALCAKADAHTSLAMSTLADPVVAWRHLSLASAALGAASKLEPMKAEIYLARGDTEVLRARLPVEQAVKAHAILRKNAGVFYRGAMKFGSEITRAEAEIKEKIVRWEDGEEGAVDDLVVDDVVREVVGEAVEEGVFGHEWLAKLALSE